MIVVMAIIGLLIWRGLGYDRWLSKTIVVLCVFMLVGTISEGLWRHNEAVGTKMVRSVSGEEYSTLICNRPTGEVLNKQPGGNIQGWVWSREPLVANIRYAVCLDFQSWLWSDKSHASQAQILALGIIMHEARHVGGEWGEASAECQAIERYADTVMDFGVKPKEAERMAEAYAIYNDGGPSSYVCSSDPYTD